MSLPTSATHRKMSSINMMIFLHSQVNALFGKQRNENVHNLVIGKIDSSEYRIRRTKIIVDYGHWSTFLRKNEWNGLLNRNINFHCKSKQIIQSRCDVWMWITMMRDQHFKIINSVYSCSMKQKQQMECDRIPLSVFFTVIRLTYHFRLRFSLKLTSLGVLNTKIGKSNLIFYSNHNPFG